MRQFNQEIFLIEVYGILSSSNSYSKSIMKIKDSSFKQRTLSFYNLHPLCIYITQFVPGQFALIGILLLSFPNPFLSVLSTHKDTISSSGDDSLFVFRSPFFPSLLSKTCAELMGIK